MRVRQAGIADLDVLVCMGEEMRQESLIFYPEIDIGKVRMLLEHQEKNDTEFIVFLAEDDEPCGFMVALIGSPLFTDDTFAFHHIFFVRPEKRGSLAAVRLIKAYEQWARDHDAGAVEISVDTGLWAERTGKFYQRMGYEHMGGRYRKWVR